jgi:hypothetical protein
MTRRPRAIGGGVNNASILCGGRVGERRGRTRDQTRPTRASSVRCRMRSARISMRIVVCSAVRVIVRFRFNHGNAVF